MNSSKKLFLLAFFLLLAAVFLVRLPSSLLSNNDWDESNYFVIAQDMVHGGVPYKTSFDFKGPLLYFVLAPVVAVFGDNVVALHLFTTLYLLCAMIGVFLVSRKLFGPEASLVPPLVYGFFFSVDLGGLSSNGELFMMLPVIFALYFLLRHREKPSRKFLLLSGLFSAAAVLFKQTAFFSLLPLPLVLIYWERRSLASAVRALGFYIGGGTLLFTAVCCYFIFHNAFFEFIHAYFLFGGQYVAQIPLQVGLDRFASFFVTMLLHQPTTMAAWGCLLFCLFNFRSMSQRQMHVLVFILTLLLLSLVGVCWGRNMFSHYYLQVSLALALLIGLAVTLTRMRAATVNKAVLVVLVFWAAVFLPQDMKRFVLIKDNLAHDPERVVAAYVKEHTTPDQTIFVLRGQPVIYFLAGRKSPTKFFFWYLYHSEWRDILGLEAYARAYFPLHPPEFFVYYLPDNRNVPFLEDFMRENYRIETVLGGYAIARLKRS